MDAKRRAVHDLEMIAREVAEIRAGLERDRQAGEECSRQLRHLAERIATRGERLDGSLFGDDDSAPGVRPRTEL
jgi:hypothetical protein